MNYAFGLQKEKAALATRLTTPKTSQFLNEVNSVEAATITDKALSRLSEMNSHGKVIENVNYCGSVLSRADFSNATLSKVDMNSIYGEDFKAKQTNLSYVDFSMANLVSGSFEGANLEFVFFIGADLKFCDFDGVTCNKGVLMIGSTLEPALKPEGAILTPDDLKLVIDQYDSQELKLLENTLKQAAIDVASYRASPNADKNYLTPSHLDHINQTIAIVENALRVKIKPR